MIISITGYRGSGKTFLARSLSNGKLPILSFAGPLKNFTDQLINKVDYIHHHKDLEIKPDFNMEMVRKYNLDYDQLKNIKYGRDLLKFVADSFRKTDSDYYAKLMYEKIINLDPNLDIIIDDLRFENEFEYLIKTGRKIKFIWVSDFGHRSTDSHSSENILSLVEKYIEMNK